MKHFTFFFVAFATIAGFVAFSIPAPGHAEGASAPNFVTEIPHGYRDWQWISSAHEAGNLNSLGAVLGNDVAIKAFREGQASISGWHDHRRVALPSRPIGRKQQSLWPGPIFRSRRSHKHSVHG